MMIPDCRRRLAAAHADLQQILVSNTERHCEVEVLKKKKTTHLFRLTTGQNCIDETLKSICFVATTVANSWPRWKNYMV